MSDEEKDGVKVTDKRRFTAEGEGRDDVEAPVEEPRESTPEPEKKQQQSLPQIDFATFALSLASSAQIHLGLIPNPVTGQSEKNLNLAKQTIDILGMLKEKTQNNLDKNEEGLLEGVLYDLRMKYVELQKEGQ